MYHYAFRQWLVFFYFYCICGWIYESTLVSVKSKKLTNRGFMKGPWIPLYGSGAVVVLFCTLPFQKWPGAVFFVGMIAATILEYVTGVMMMKLFKVRYWDYTNLKFQFQGHICLIASLVWGCFSLLMVYIVHRPVEKLIFMIPGEVVSILTFVITVLFVFDFANAFRDAMDLRAMLVQMETLKKQLHETVDEKRGELEERIGEKREALEKNIEESRAELEKNIEEKKEDLRERIELTRYGIEDRIKLKRDEIEESYAELRDKLELEAKIEALRKRMEKSSRQLLLQNPTSDFVSLSDEARKMKERLRRK